MAENDRKNEVEPGAGAKQEDTASSPPKPPATEHKHVGDQQAERERVAREKAEAEEAERERVEREKAEAKKALVSTVVLVSATLLFSLGFLLCAVAFAFGAIPWLMATEYLSKTHVCWVSVIGFVILLGGVGLGLPKVAMIARSADSHDEPKRSKELYGIYLIGTGFAFLKLTIICSLVFVGVAWSLSNPKPHASANAGSNDELGAANSSNRGQRDQKGAEKRKHTNVTPQDEHSKANAQKPAKTDVPAGKEPEKAGDAQKNEPSNARVGAAEPSQDGACQQSQSASTDPPSPAAAKPASSTTPPQTTTTQTTATQTAQIPDRPNSTDKSKDSFGQLFGRSKEEAFKIIGLFAISSLVAAMGALFFFCSSLWSKMDEPSKEPFDRRLFWGGLWFRLGEAMLFNVVFFLVIRSYSPESDLMLPLVSLFVGMFLKTGETIISGIAARVFAAVQQLIPAAASPVKVLKIVSFKLKHSAPAADDKGRRTQAEQLVKALKDLPGVTDAQGDAATNAFQVEYDEIRITPADIRRRIALAGWSEDSSA